MKTTVSENSNLPSPSVAQNLSKALINHELLTAVLILISNRKFNFYNTFKTDTNRTEFLLRCNKKYRKKSSS